MNWDELRGFRDERLVLMDKYQYAILWEALTEEQKLNYDSIDKIY